MPAAQPRRQSTAAPERVCRSVRGARSGITPTLDRRVDSLSRVGCVFLHRMLGAGD